MDEFGYKVKRGTEEDWATYLEKYKEEYGEDYIPSEGKLLAVGFVNEDDGKVLYKLKVGNGTTTFDKLPYTDEITNTGITIEELQEEIESKQDVLTAGNGLDISNDEISVKLYNSQDNGLMFNSDGTLALFKSVLGMDSTFRNYLTGTSANNPLQPLIDSTHKLSADNVDDTNSTNKFVPNATSSDYGKYLHNNNGTLEWSSVSGGSSEWTLIKSVDISELAEPVYAIDITEDSQGNAFAYDDIFIVFTSLTTVNANQNLKHSFRVQDNHYAGSWVGGVIGNAVTTTARNFYVKEERELETMWTETRSSNGTVSSFIKTADWANGKKIDEIKVESDTFSGGVIDFYGRNKQ